MEVSKLLSRENNNLDLIRILLACFVIIGHAQPLNGPSNYWADPVTLLFNFTYSGALAVKLFFFISGLVVTNSLITNKSALHFIISRIFRIVPALLVVLLLTVFVIGPVVTEISLHDYFSSKEIKDYIIKNLSFVLYDLLPGVFISNFFANSVNGSLWTLGHEVRCYLTLLGAFLILQNRRKIFWNIIVLLIIIEPFLPVRFIYGSLGDSSEIYLLPVAFAIGVFFAINADKIEIKWSIVAGFFLISYLFRKTMLVELLFIMFFSVFILKVATSKIFMKLKPRYDISYGTYLWGFLVQQTLFHYTGHINTWLHCILALIISMALALVTFVFIEQPFIKLGKHIYQVLKNKFISTGNIQEG